MKATGKKLLVVVGDWSGFARKIMQLVRKWLVTTSPRLPLLPFNGKRGNRGRCLCSYHVSHKPPLGGVASWYRGTSAKSGKNGKRGMPDIRHLISRKSGGCKKIHATNWRFFTTNAEA